MILASTAAAMDKQVEVFFSFYGVKCLFKDVSGLRVSPVGNPAMILKSPVGPGWLRRIDWNSVLPQLVWVLPGMTALATKGFRKTMAQQNQLPFEELRQLCLDMGVKFTVCTMAYDLLGMDQDDLIEGVEFAGAATYFANSPRSQSLFI